MSNLRQQWRRFLKSAEIPEKSPSCHFDTTVGDHQEQGMNRRGFMAALGGLASWLGVWNAASRPDPDYASIYFSARQESDYAWLVTATYRGLMTKNELRRMGNS